MNFQDLIYHIQENGCNFDHLEDNRYEARNCINAEFCEIEDLPVYSDVTLCHYFYELGIPTPPELYAVYEKYRDLRDNIIINLPSN